jgi:hypothetical protein
MPIPPSPEPPMLWLVIEDEILVEVSRSSSTDFGPEQRSAV